ncbi:MAG: S26 family signal peptidase [Ruminococcus flavefaciens]
MMKNNRRFQNQVPENCVFVLNDFRSDISDSRTCGGVPLEDVEGAGVFTMRMRGI